MLRANPSGTCRGTENNTHYQHSQKEMPEKGTPVITDKEAPPERYAGPGPESVCFSPDADGVETPLELPIFIPYRPSKRVCLFNSLVHAGALFCLVLTDIQFGLAGLIGAGVLAHYGCYLKQFLFPEDVCFKLDRGDRWQLLRENHEAVDLKLLPGALVHPRIVVLCFREPGRRTRACVLTHDNLDQQTLRRLRVRLRWPL